MGDKQLYKIFWTRKFYHLYELEENVTLILNSLSVWTIKDGSFCSKVDFDIFTDNDQKRYISPKNYGAWAKIITNVNNLLYGWLKNA